MKQFAIAAACAALALGGCNFIPGMAGGNETAGNAANGLAANQSSGSKDPVQTADAGITQSRSLQAMSGDKDPSAAGGATPAMLVGRWTDDGNCGRNTLIRPDGTFRAIDGGEGRWRLDGDELTMSGDQASITVRVEFADPDTINVYQANGTTGQSTRC